jgi:hypothetical protein
MQLHEDLNLVTKKPYTERPEGDGTNDEAISTLAWQRHEQRENSLIRDVVGSQLRSQLMCLQCGKVSVCFEYQQTIQVAIPRNNNRVIRILFVPQFDVVSKSLTRRPVKLAPNGQTIAHTDTQTHVDSHGENNAHKRSKPRKDAVNANKAEEDMEWAQHYVRRREALRPILLCVSVDRLSPVQALRNAVSMKVRSISVSDTMDTHANDMETQQAQQQSRARGRSRSGSLSCESQYVSHGNALISLLEVGGHNQLTLTRILKDDDSIARYIANATSNGSLSGVGTQTPTIVAYSGMEKPTGGIFLLQVNLNC